MKRKLAGLAAGAALALGAVYIAVASSHREAPLISSDPLGRQHGRLRVREPRGAGHGHPDRQLIPLEAPGGGPNFYKFGDDVLYRINIDNDGDAKDDIADEFKFTTDVQHQDTFLYNTGPINSLTDPTFNVRQRYSVTRYDHGGRTVLADNLATPPVNVGARSTPNYAGLANSAIYTLTDGSKVFAGQRDDPFFVDLDRCSTSWVSGRSTPPI